MSEVIPKTQDGKLAFLVNASRMLAANPDRYAMDSSKVEAFAALAAQAQEARAKTEAVRNDAKSATVALGSTLDDAESAFRAIANELRANLVVGGEALAELGLYRRAAPSRNSAPAEPPVLALEQINADSVTINVRRADGRRAKPDRVSHIELSLVEAPAKPLAGEAERGLKQLITRTRSTVPTSIRAARVRLYARWVTLRSEYSPWSLPVEFRP